MELLPIKYPYVPQSVTPDNITKYMVIETPLEDFDFQTFITCGTKAEVVNIAAKKPMISTSITLQY